MDTTLYPGIAFSPQAALADNIGAADTIIKVTDASAFPDAPNLATIGTDEEGETILYAAKTAQALSGCTRGVEGAARAWNAGEAIGRNFTAKDHNDLIAAVQAAQLEVDEAPTEGSGNPVSSGGTFDALQDVREAASAALAAKQDTLTGQPGQVVGFDGMGLACAVRGWSNQNLLDNWYFADPVNQRGQTEYTGSGYGIDRWRILTNALSINVAANCVQFTANSTNAGKTIYQPLCDYDKFAGETLTLTVLYKSNAQVSVGFFLNGTTSGCVYEQKTAIEADETIRMLTTTFVCPSSDIKMLSPFISLPNGTDDVVFPNGGYSNAYADIYAAKLELGPIQTLAHQDADGNWVLNDPPPNKALELAKCQRYYYVSSSNMLLDNCHGADTSIAMDETYTICGIRFPVTMRVVPSVSIKLLAKWNNVAGNNLVDGSADVTARNITKEGFAAVADFKKRFIAHESYYIKYVADANL